MKLIWQFESFYWFTDPAVRVQYTQVDRELHHATIALSLDLLASCSSLPECSPHWWISAAMCNTTSGQRVFVFWFAMCNVQLQHIVVVVVVLCSRPILMKGIPSSLSGFPFYSHRKLLMSIENFTDRASQTGNKTY